MRCTRRVEQTNPPVVSRGQLYDGGPGMSGSARRNLQGKHSTMKQEKISIFFIFCFLPGTVFAAPPWNVGNYASFFQGAYGTGHTISIFYDATELAYRQNGLKLKLTVPFEVVSGLPQGAAITGGGSIAQRASSASAATHSASGLGDIWLSGRYTLIPVSRRHLGFDVYSKIKLGTASYSEGLGTGQNDYELGGGINGYVSPNGYPFADLGYRVVGSPSGVPLNNIVTYDAGYSYVLDRKNIWTLMLTGHEAEQSGASPPADLLLAWNYNPSDAGGVQVFVDKGLTQGSSDYGVGVGGHLYF